MSKIYYFFTIFVSGFIFLSLCLIFYKLFDLSFDFSYYDWHDLYLYKIIQSTFLQATVSSIIIILLAIPLARAFHRNQKFLGRRLLIRFFGVAFIMPVIVIISGLISIHGSNGIINQIFNHFGISLGSYLYGFSGILTAHIVFNLPFATRLILESLDSIPHEFWRIASQLGMKSRNIFWIIELPIIKHTILKIFGLVFVMCFTSFSIILILGGHLKYTTLEVAIYQALKLDFDLAYAVVLSSIQLLICGVFIYFIHSLTPVTRMNMTEKAVFSRPDANSRRSKMIDFTFIIISLLLIVSPLLVIILKGMNFSLIPTILSLEFRNAFIGSFKIAIPSGLLSLFLSSCLVTLAYNIKFKFNKPGLSNKIVSFVNIFLCVPPFIMATGIIVVFGNLFNVFDYSTTMVIIINSLTILPFITNTILSSLNNITLDHRNLGLSLGIKESKFFFYVIWPEIRQSVGFSLAVSVTACIGNLGIINLLGSDNLSTLPLLLYQRLSNFQLEESSAIALCLLIISYMLFWSIEKFVGAWKWYA